MFKLTCAIVVFFVSFSIYSQAAYNGGTGSVGDPFQIATPEQMNSIGLNPNDWDDHFILTADIDMSSFAGTEYNIIGSGGTPFTGSFNGNGFDILNFTYSSPTATRAGLFSRIVNAELSNISLVNAYVEAPASVDAGALAAEAFGCTITNCRSEGIVLGLSDLGGLIGDAGNSTITGCASSGTVTGTERMVGGLVGLHKGAMQQCSSHAVTSGEVGVGGLVGVNGGSITSCFVAGDVSGSRYIGGLVGSNQGVISRCYAMGPVDGAISDIGGLVGDNDQFYGATITQCYAMGTVGGPANVGGLLGTGSGSLAGCFWDTQTSGTTDGVGSVNPDPTGVSGKTTFQMKTKSTFVGWDFSAADGDPADWKIQAGVDYPRLFWQPVSPAPVATPIALTVTDTDEKQIILTATDDGLPGPLSYIIASLPEHGRLTDPGFGPITAVPYTLLNELHTVNYLPCVYAYGQDQFTFLANDTGYAPNGGNSNEAAVTITFDYDLAVGQQTSLFSPYPLNTNRNDCRLQIIYTKADFGAASVITGFDVYVKYKAAKTMTNFTIRMQPTALSVYPAEPDFTNSGWTTVFRDDVTISSTGVYRFDFQTPFAYDGLQNVLVDISFDNEIKGFSNGELYTINASGRTIYQTSLGLYGDPLLWTRSMFGALETANSAPLVLKLHRQSPVAPIVSDFNVDCSVGVLDLEALAAVWLSQQGDGMYSALYDISTPADQVINLADFAVFASEWMSGPYDEPDYSPYDFNRSTDVDLPDLLMLAGAWLTSEGQPGFDEALDLADNQTIDLADFAVFSQHWMESL
ncbi:MAG: hypothetical protein LLF76_13285 [Planctomycetaceae bacterium]|nr:hypothetical protein [Planctomycetaceae bacterium]